MQGVSVSRGGRDILGPLDFKIQNGERWVILGPNGAGKSTLLNILSTRIFPTKGTVKILDKEMGKVDLSELRTRIGICASLLAEDIPAQALYSNDDQVVVPPLHGALLKNEQDVHLFERLVMMNRNNR